jgi:hypothetical protein
MRRSIVIGCAAVAAIAGCSQEMAQPPAALAGTWTFRYVMATEDGATCSGNMQFTISQTDQTFTGSQQGAAALACVDVAPAIGSLDGSNNTVFANEVISGGVASESEVAFALNTLNGANTGTVTKDGMSGESTWQIPVNPRGTVAMRGNWTAVKQ